MSPKTLRELVEQFMLSTTVSQQLTPSVTSPSVCIGIVYKKDERGDFLLIMLDIDIKVLIDNHANTRYAIP